MKRLKVQAMLLACLPRHLQPASLCLKLISLKAIAPFKLRRSRTSLCLPIGPSKGRSYLRSSRCQRSSFLRSIWPWVLIQVPSHLGR